MKGITQDYLSIECRAALRLLGLQNMPDRRPAQAAVGQMKRRDNMVNDIENAVTEWYETTYNHKSLFAKTKPVLTLETSLSTGKYAWARETGDEIMKDYFQRFNVDSSRFHFLSYWPYEKGILPNFLRTASQQIPEVQPKPLTLQMLIESAKAGRWLYD